MSKSILNAHRHIQEFGAQILADVDTTLGTIPRRSRCSSDIVSQLDANIVYLQESVVNQLRKRRNLLVPFLCLPPEVIEQVALALAKSFPSGVLDCINLTKVCSSLRSLLLNYRELWAATAFTLPDAGLCKMIIDRARGSPLSVRFDVGTFIQPLDRSPMMRLLKEHFASICTVRVSESKANDGFCNVFTCDELSAVELPLLRSMHISTSKPGPTLASSNRYTCPPMLTPNLRYLALSNAYVPFDPSTLTELSLSTTGRYGSNPDWIPPAAHFLNILRQSRNLRVLKLRATIPELGEEASQLPISFPRLEVLSVPDLAHKCFALWPLLIVPPQATVHLHLPARTPAAPIKELSCLRSIGTSATAVYFTYDYNPKLYLFKPVADGYEPPKYSDIDPNLPAAFKRHGLLICLEFDVEGATSPVSYAATMLPDCATVLGLGSIQTLHIATNQAYPAKDWCLMLGPFKGVQTLEISTLQKNIVYGRQSAKIDHAGIVQALHGGPNGFLPLLQVLRIPAIRIFKGCPIEMLLLLARSRKLQHLRIDLLAFSRDYSGCDATRWHDERQAFMDHMEAMGTHAEGFRARQRAIPKINK